MDIDSHITTDIIDYVLLHVLTLCRSAEENGLGRSLFERYADICKKRGIDSDDAGCFICLKVQYRMVWLHEVHTQCI